MVRRYYYLRGRCTCLFYGLLFKWYDYFSSVSLCRYVVAVGLRGQAARVKLGWIGLDSIRFDSRFDKHVFFIFCLGLSILPTSR